MQNVACFNDPEQDRVIFSESCDCNWEDYEWYDYTKHKCVYAYNIFSDIGYVPSARNSTDGFTCTLYVDNAFGCSSGY